MSTSSNIMTASTMVFSTIPIETSMGSHWPSDVTILNCFRSFQPLFVFTALVALIWIEHTKVLIERNWGSVNKIKPDRSLTHTDTRPGHGYVYGSSIYSWICFYHQLIHTQARNKTEKNELNVIFIKCETDKLNVVCCLYCFFVVVVVVAAVVVCNIV